MVYLDEFNVPIPKLQLMNKDELLKYLKSYGTEKSRYSIATTSYMPFVERAAQIVGVENYLPKSLGGTLHEDPDINLVITSIKNAEENQLELNELLTNIVNSFDSIHDLSAKKIVMTFLINLLVLITFDMIQPKLTHLKTHNLPLKKDQIIEITGDIEINKNSISNYRIVTADLLNVREAPSRKSGKMGLLELNTPVILHETKKDWSSVEYKDESNQVYIKGWVFTRYLKKII